MSGDGRRPSRTLTFDHNGTVKRFTARRLLAGGYTGRDPVAVEEHIAELALLGVPRPDHVPWVFVANPELLRMGGTVRAYDGTSSGEAEYVLLIGRNDVFVCIGSDHTDRGLESLSIEKSKQIYPKIVSRQVWRLDELLPRWDDLRLRSRVREDGELEDYQDGTLSQLMRPERLLDLIGPDPGVGTAVFSGTLPVLGGHVRPAPRFEAELFDTDGSSLANLGYDVVVLQQQVQPDER